MLSQESEMAGRKLRSQIEENGKYDAVADMGAAYNQCNLSGAWKPPSMADVAEKRASQSMEEAQKHGAAAKFFREHPEFEEFINLIRLGAIQF